MADFKTYKGLPLIRKDNVIYYGNMTDAYVIRLTVLSEQNGVAERIKIELMLSDTSLPEQDRIQKTSEKEGFFAALELSSTWLSRYNAG